MILRAVVLALTLANLLVYGWTEGWFDGVFGLSSAGDREPARVLAQVSPEAMKLSKVSARIVEPREHAAVSVALPASQGAKAAGRVEAGASSDAPVPDTAAASSAAIAASAPASAASSAHPMLACLESGPYALGKDMAAAESFLKANVPAEGWTRVASESAGVWMIYMGRYADQEVRKRKEAELARRRAHFEEVDEPPEFARGLSLGKYPSKAEAEAGLAELGRQGVRTARIVTFVAPAALQTFRVEKADPVLADKLHAARLALPFSACKN